MFQLLGKASPQGVILEMNGFEQGKDAAAEEAFGEKDGDGNTKHGADQQGE